MQLERATPQGGEGDAGASGELAQDPAPETEITIQR